MKNFVTTTLLVVLCLSKATTFAQTAVKKTFLFNNYPAAIPCTASQLNNLFTSAKGEKIQVSFNDKLTLIGAVTSNTVKYNSLQSIVIQLPAFNNILFSLSKRIEKNNSVVYIGHLFSKDYADGYELKKINENNYQLVKIDMQKVLQDCSQ